MRGPTERPCGITATAEDQADRGGHRLDHLGRLLPAALAGRRRYCAVQRAVDAPDEGLEEARKKCGLDKAGLLEQITDFIGPV